MSMSGCGTHLMMELLRQAGYQLLIDEIKMLQAYLLARRNPQIPAPIPQYFAQPVEQVFANLAARIGFPEFDGVPDENILIDAFGANLAESDFERFAIIHSYSLSVSRTHSSPDGVALPWLLADRDELQALLNRVMARAGCDFRRVAFIRNPIDIYLSQRERQNRDALKEVREFYDMLRINMASETIPVVKFEEICGANHEQQKELLKSLAFDLDEIDRLDLTVVQNGEVDKWIGYPFREVQDARNFLEICLREYNYSVDISGGPALNKLTKRFRKYHSEFSVINRICSGDYSVDGAFSRHQRSLPAKLWLRLLILFPSPSRHLENYYRTIKCSEVSMRPWTVILKSIPARIVEFWRRTRGIAADS